MVYCQVAKENHVSFPGNRLAPGQVADGETALPRRRRGPAPTQQLPVRFDHPTGPTGAEAIVEAIMTALDRHEVRMRNTLMEAASTLDAQLLEGGQADPQPANQTTALTYSVSPQTRDVEIIRGILVVTPEGTTSASLQIGALVIPVQNTFLYMSPLAWPVTGHKRILTWTPASTTTNFQASLYIWASPAPANAAGVLH